MLLLTLFVLFLSLKNCVSYKYTKVGELCEIDEFKGTCKDLFQCPILMKVVNEDMQQPPICFIANKKVVVCCPTNEKSIVTGPKILIGLFKKNLIKKTKDMTCMYDSREPFLCCGNPPEKQTEPEPAGCPPLPRPELNTAVRHPAWEKCLSYQRYFNVCVATDEANTKFKRNDTCSFLDKLERERIMSGTNAAPREFPHMAVIGSADSPDEKADIKWIGGGSLISDRFILTAAHVVIETKGGVARYALLGTVNKTNIKEGLLCNIINRYGYKRYESNNDRSVKDHDIALVELFERVQFNEFIRPACLPVPNIQIKDVLTVAGWGRTNTAANSSVLLYTHLIEDTLSCRKAYNYSFKPKIMICGRGTNSRRNADACTGDSGGPLMAELANLKRSYSIEGIVAYGINCGEGAPGVYTRVSNYMDFIMQTVWPEDWMVYKEKINE